MKRPLVILGGGGGTFDLFDVIDSINAVQPTWEPLGFLDDSSPAKDRHLGLPFLGPLRDAGRFADAFFVNGISSVAHFKRLPEILASTALDAERFATLVHPAALVSTRARLGFGTVVNAGAVIGGEVVIGNHVMICSGVVLGHQSQIADHCVLAPGCIVSGLVHIESTCYLGSSAVFHPGITVGTKTLIGMGSVVLRDVAPESTLVGNPARPLRSSTQSVEFPRLRQSA